MQIGWIDFSTKDRERAKQLLAFIKPEGQLDELGVGYLRDALSNQLFPGISTIQTRAKYFFIVTYILRDYLLLSPKEKRKRNPENYLREREHEVKNKLRNVYQSKEGIGIIGVTLKDRQYVKRNASEIYWNGLQTYRFLANDGLSLKQFLKNLYNPNALELSQSEEGGDDVVGIDELQWIKTPIDNHWFEDLKITLTEEEQDFFKAQIVDNQSNLSSSLVKELVLHDELRQLFIQSDNFESFVVAALVLDFDNTVKQSLILAHDFALLMEGLHLLYNDILQNYLFGADYDGIFREEYQLWRLELEDAMIDYKGFKVQDVIQFAKYGKNGTEAFLMSWWQYIQQSDADQEPSQKIMDLISLRERITKRTKSRLHKPPTANTDITVNKYVGLSRFQYRFYNTKTIIKDIFSEPEKEKEIEEDAITE